jgi:hypothetical protein
MTTCCASYIKSNSWVLKKWREVGWSPTIQGADGRVDDKHILKLIGKAAT